MIKILKEFFNFNKEVDNKNTETFSYFFTKSSSKEKRGVFDRVIRNANKEQLDLVSRYKKIYGEGK